MAETSSESWPKYVGILVFGGIVLVVALHLLGIIDLSGLGSGGGGGGGTYVIGGGTGGAGGTPATGGGGFDFGSIGAVIAAIVLFGGMGGLIYGRHIWKKKGWTLNPEKRKVKGFFEEEARRRAELSKYYSSRRGKGESIKGAEPTKEGAKKEPYTWEEEARRLQATELGRALMAKQGKEAIKIDRINIGSKLRPRKVIKIDAAHWSGKHYDRHLLELNALLQKSLTEPNRYHYPFIDIYAGFARVSGAEKPISLEIGYQGIKVDEKISKQFNTENFPASVLSYLRNKGLEKASDEWLFTRDIKGDEKKEVDYDFRKYYTEGLVNSYARGKKGEFKIGGERSGLYLASRTLVNGILTNREEHPLDISRFDDPHIRVPGKPSDYIWAKEIIALSGIYNENSFAAEIAAGKDYKISVDDNDKDYVTRWAVYTALCSFIKKTELRSANYADIDANYDKSIRLLSKAVEHTQDSDFQAALKPLKITLEEYWDVVGSKTSKLPLSKERKEDIRKHIKAVNGTAVELMNMVVELERILPNLMRLYKDNLALDYVHLKEEEVENKLASAVTPMVMVNFGLAARDTAKDEADKLIAEAAPKVITLIKTMYEPVMYDIISMAVLTMVLRKYVGFLVGVTDEASRFVALIPPKYTKWEKMPK